MRFISSRLSLLLLVAGASTFANRVAAQERVANDAFSVAAVLEHRQAFDRPHDIELQGDLAFVPGKGGSLAIVDVSDPTAPRLIWHRHDAEELLEAETVLPVGNRLFLGTNDFMSIDVTNPRQPVFGKVVSDRSWMTRINGMVRRGDSIFAACKDGWLVRFDVSDPRTPAVAGTLNVRKQHDVGWPHDVDTFGEFLVVPDPQRFGEPKRPGKLAVYRVFDSAGRPLPAQQWRLEGMVESELLIGANRVQVSGRHAFVGASTRSLGGRFIVVDLSDPGSPRQKTWLPFAHDDGSGPNGLTIVGDVVFLAGGHSVEAIDISKPDHPIKLVSQRFTNTLRNARPRPSGGGDSGHDLVYRGGYLYVTGQNDDCLLILRVESQQIRRLAEST